MTARGGVVLKIGERLAFIPAEVALRIAHAPRIARVAGAPGELLGIALHEGTILPVISIGDARDRMVVCDHMGELLGLVGGVVVRTGIVDEKDGRIEIDGQVAAPLDVAEIYARVQTGGWVARWGA